jgi:DNA-binding transcriptional MerR regulator
MSSKNGPIQIPVSEVAQMLGISQTLIRFWEEEFGMPKRENGTMSKLEAAEIKFIHQLITDKGMTLEDAKAEFASNKQHLELRIKSIENLQKIKLSLQELKNKMQD